MTAPNNQPLSKEAFNRFKAYQHQHFGNGSSCFHIVLENKNIKDGHVQFCRELAVKRNDQEALELADILLSLSKSQRLKLANKLST